MKRRTAWLLMALLVGIVGLAPCAMAQKSDTEIVADAQRNLRFLYPKDQTVPYETAEQALGSVSLQDLILHEDETLQITAECDAFAAPDGSRIPFTAACEEMPAAISEDGSWVVRIYVEDTDWAAAAPGTYTGVIRWSVRSSRDDAVLVTAETQLTTTVPDAEPADSSNPPPADSSNPPPTDSGDPPPTGVGFPIVSAAIGTLAAMVIAALCLVVRKRQKVSQD